MDESRFRICNTLYELPRKCLSAFSVHVHRKRKNQTRSQGYNYTKDMLRITFVTRKFHYPLYVSIIVCHFRCSYILSLYLRSPWEKKQKKLCGGYILSWFTDTPLYLRCFFGPTFPASAWLIFFNDRVCLFIRSCSFI